MKTHVQIGVEALDSAEKRVGMTPFLHTAREIAQNHHEKWDGSGYPHGLKGEAIPLSGRLMAVADVFDALVNKRVYKEPISADEALAIIRSESGKHFDPKIITALNSVEPSFKSLAVQS
jgi:response regulator RpfG family c-di-GMP phosphodiesterase